MKTNTLHLITSSLESLVIAIILVLISAIATAQAQHNTSFDTNFNSALNGIFFPTAADRFFQVGREDFEREIDFVARPEKYLTGELLQIDAELIKQMQEISVNHFESDNLPISESVFTGY